MGKAKRRHVSVDEQKILEDLKVRVLTSKEDIARCDDLIVQHHYLHEATLVGEQLRYVATYKGEWLALATWSGAAFHLKDRDEFIGWDFEQCRRRRALLANNSRLLVLPGRHSANLISRFMSMMLGRLSEDWLEQWKHPLALVESFVDPQLYQGTAYKVSGWSHLGRTAGWKRDASDFYVKHDAPKQIWVRELVKKACVKLRATQLPSEWAMVEGQTVPRCRTPVREIRSLRESLRAQLPEFRRLQALGYPLAGMVCLIVMAMAAGVRHGPDDLAQFADTLSQAQLRALGFRRDKQSGQTRFPKKTTFHRVLSAVDAPSLQRILLQWQQQLLGRVQDSLVVVDGKKMRHGGVEMVNAVNGAGQYLGGVMTEAKSNEIPAARQVLKPLDLKGKIVLADALHTQVETGQQILYEQGGDYLLTVKGNQPTLQATLQNLFEKQGFSPSAHRAHAQLDTGAQSGPLGNPFPAVCGGDSQPGGLSGGQTGGTIGDEGQARRQVDQTGDLSVEQFDLGATAGPGDAPT
jgi:predicted transposase YbfD/YdcC